MKVNEGARRASTKWHFVGAALVSLASLLLLMLTPESVKPWVHEHLPALRHPVRCGNYGHLFFAIGVVVSGVGLTWGIVLSRRGLWTIAARLSVTISALLTTGWLLWWPFVRAGTMCIS